jgi:hypothetical protein
VFLFNLTSIYELCCIFLIDVSLFSFIVGILSLNLCILSSQSFHMM